MGLIVIALATSYILQLYMCVSAAATSESRIAMDLPFVNDYAPIVYLHSTDPYRPADIGGQLQHTVPMVNRTAIPNAPSPLSLNNLDALNLLGNNSIYLTATDYINANDNPAWTKGTIPSPSGETEGATSCAIIINQHNDTDTDVFYMYFYAFNYGGTALGINLGNHVGDWEYNMIRFHSGTPTAIWYSQHSGGEAFSYSAVEKRGLRPVGYSATGTHANYPTAGTHSRIIPGFPGIPGGALEDYTDAGLVWDPTLSAYYYRYNGEGATFSAYDGDGTPVGWLNYNGRWGDQQYPDSDSRQLNLFDNYRYENGPEGPKFKQLNRNTVCDGSTDDCVIRNDIILK